MKLSSLLLTASLAVSSVFAVPHQHDKFHNEKRQSGYLPVAFAGGPVWPRLEIRQMFFNRPTQFTLLLLALEKWQAMPQSDKRSYYQISGIHGVPSVDWDGVGACDGCKADGYCPHDSILFPAWHRVYVALYEQVFLNIVNDIANNWSGPDASSYRAAASQMRWPYWDWAAQPRPGYSTFPQIIGMRWVAVANPGGGTRTIVNPLFRYTFQDNSELKYYPFNSNWRYTFRAPTTNEGNAMSDNQQIINTFNNIRPSLQDTLYQLFTTCDDYSHFSNDRSDSSSTSCSSSLEGIHNTVHTAVGGKQDGVVAGHMFYLSTASFDPVFWLHHANVDRIFAMWQQIHPDAYGGGQFAKGSTWTIKQGDYQDENSPLKPMHKDIWGNFYTTKDVKDWTVFGYTYPEFFNSDGSADSINRYINNLYGPSATQFAATSKRDVEGDDEEVDEEEASVVERSFFSDVVDKVDSAMASEAPKLSAIIQNVTTTVSQLINPVKANNGSLYQYVANVQAPRYALNGTYTIYLFNGKPACETPSKWMADPALVGPIGVLAMPGMTGHDVNIAASIPLTRTLTYALANKYLTDLSEELVVPYLHSNLFWRVGGPDGTSVPTDSIKGFKVEVFGTTMKPCDAGGLPKYSDFIPLKKAVKDCISNLLQ